jgi:protein-tyrosine-phosphatase
VTLLVPAHSSPVVYPGAVLFCCTLNALRSPMAAAMLRQLHGQRIYVDSVGVRAGELDGFAVSVMDEFGIDITKHKPRTFEDLEDSSFDLIISLSPEAQHKAVEMTRTMACDVEFWNTFDPSIVEGSREQRMEVYRDVRDGLMQRIRERFPVAGAPKI